MTNPSSVQDSTKDKSLEFSYQGIESFTDSAGKTHMQSDSFCVVDIKTSSLASQHKSSIKDPFSGALVGPDNFILVSHPGSGKVSQHDSQSTIINMSLPLSDNLNNLSKTLFSNQITNAKNDGESIALEALNSLCGGNSDAIIEGRRLSYFPQFIDEFTENILARREGYITNNSVECSGEMSFTFKNGVPKFSLQRASDWDADAVNISSARLADFIEEAYNSYCEKIDNTKPINNAEQHYQAVILSQLASAKPTLTEALRVCREDPRVDTIKKSVDPIITWWNSRANTFSKAKLQLKLYNTSVYHNLSVALLYTHTFNKGLKECNTMDELLNCVANILIKREYFLKEVEVAYVRDIGPGNLTPEIEQLFSELTRFHNAIACQLSHQLHDVIQENDFQQNPDTLSIQNSIGRSDLLKYYDGIQSPLELEITSSHKAIEQTKRFVLDEYGQAITDADAQLILFFTQLLLQGPLSSKHNDDKDNTSVQMSEAIARMDRADVSASMDEFFKRVQTKYDHYEIKNSKVVRNTGNIKNNKKKSKQPFMKKDSKISTTKPDLFEKQVIFKAEKSAELKKYYVDIEKFPTLSSIIHYFEQNITQLKNVSHDQGEVINVVQVIDNTPIDRRRILQAIALDNTLYEAG